jgi:DNA-binding transcriptional regulator LsrR (DeoR family)
MTSKKHTGLPKLTGEQVQAMRFRYSLGETQRELARAYGVSPAQVSRVVRHEAWTEPEPEEQEQ